MRASDFHDAFVEKVMAAKTFRIAVEGQTTDGREILRQDILDMASTYNQQTYGARIWMEHYRSAIADSPFKAYGDVLSLKSDVITDGDLKGKLALFGTIDPTPDMVAMAKAKQKVYFSIEITPNFAGTGKAYLAGLGVTDSPASLGTEYIKFSSTAQNNPLASRKQKPENFISTAECVWEFTEEPISEPSLFSKIMARLKPKEEQTKQNFGDVEQALTEVANYCTELKSEVDKFGQKVTTLERELATEKQAFAEFKGKMESQPADRYTQRPISTGGDQAKIEATDC
ncbi:MAG: GPO family capsid scaffolding protein [Agitococcus sp.]|nr:GPO family capsid scaffolding protein [Agitococcus sp.]